MQQASSLLHTGSRAGVNGLAIQHNNTFTFVCPVATQASLGGQPIVKGRYVWRPGPAAARPARARRAQAAILVGSRSRVNPGFNQRALRAVHGSRAPAHPERVTFARLQPLARLPARARCAALSRPPPEGLPNMSALRAEKTTISQRASRAEKNARKSLACGARPAVADLHRSHERL